jgi:Pentapeptide repeats (9 copies)
MARRDSTLANIITSTSEEEVLYKEQQKDDLEYNDAVFKYSTFEKLGIRNVKMKGGAIKQSILDDVYARKGKFEKVDFTGTTFHNCNFDDAIFEDCIFKYCKFYNTLIQAEQIKKCLPKEANLRKELAQNLKVNYTSLGQKENSDKFLDIEIEATQAELWAIFISKDRHYRDKYNWTAQVASLFEFIGFKISSFLWGYGHKVKKLIFSFTVIFFILSLVLYISQQGFQEELPVVNKEINKDSLQSQPLAKREKTDIVEPTLVILDSSKPKTTQKLNFFQSIKIIASESVGYSTAKSPENDSARFIIFLAKLLGIIYLGLLVSTLHRKIAR